MFDSILQSRASCEPDPSYADGRVPKALAKACTSFLHDYAVSSYTYRKVTTGADRCPRININTIRT